MEKSNYVSGISVPVLFLYNSMFDIASGKVSNAYRCAIFVAVLTSICELFVCLGLFLCILHKLGSIPSI